MAALASDQAIVGNDDDQPTCTAPNAGRPPARAVSVGDLNAQADAQQDRNGIDPVIGGMRGIAVQARD